jgi:hypothetical protein
MLKNALFLVMSFSLAGCLLTIESDGRMMSTTWDEADVTRLQIGQSDTDWVKVTFGDPTSILTYADGKEVWKYRNHAEKNVEVGLFLVFSVDIEKERIETLSIEFAQAIVTDYWIEEDTF